MRPFTALLGAAVLAGCASPSTRISATLQEQGLDPARSDCVGARLEQSLSVAQLLQLSRAARSAGAGDATPGRLTVADLVRVSSSIEDPRIPLAVARAVGACDVIPAAVNLVR